MCAKVRVVGGRGRVWRLSGFLCPSRLPVPPFLPRLVGKASLACGGSARFVGGKTPSVEGRHVLSRTRDSAGMQGSALVTARLAALACHESKACPRPHPFAFAPAACSYLAQHWCKRSGAGSRTDLGRKIPRAKVALGAKVDSKFPA